LTAKLDYRWNLRNVMADHGMFSTTKLKPMLAERGILLSDSQVYRLVTERPERLSLKVLVALLDILGCRMEDLIEPVSAGRRQRKAVGETPSAEGSDKRLGELRPKRARVAPTHD
jgi:DNA-binding Xre family transcriptional regulator